MHMRGVLKLQQCNYPFAEELLRKSARITPDDPWVHFHLAEVLAACGNHDAAVVCFEQALSLGGDDADIYYMYGNSLFELKDSDAKMPVGSIAKSSLIKDDTHIAAAAAATAQQI